jgi:hypothetical protein
MKNNRNINVNKWYNYYINMNDHLLIKLHCFAEN